MGFDPRSERWCRRRSAEGPGPQKKPRMRKRLQPGSKSALLSARELYPSPFTDASCASGGEEIRAFSPSTLGTKGLLSEEAVDANSETLLREIG